MLLKVGELARRTGVTVRALHHYDSIGLLRPSGRSEGGYRLYDRDDVARLHGIQTLRQLGVPLAEVARLLQDGGTSLQAVVARQIDALDLEIERTRALRERLGAMQQVLARGGQPAIGDWLASLSMMRTYQQHFSADELRRAFERWAQCADEWPPLVQALRAARDGGVAADAPALQTLVQQWIDLVATRWMDGDTELLGRWGRMLRLHPELPLPAGLDLALIDYVDEAIRQRLATLARHVDPEAQQRLARDRADWRAWLQRGHALLAEGVPPGAPSARELARDWQALLQRTFGDDAALRERVLSAYERDPLLNAGMAITPALRRYVQAAAGAPAA